jgi:hypothetical protein
MDNLLVVGELGLVLHARTQTNRRSFPLEAEGHLLLLRRAENLRHPAKNAKAAASENLAAAFENDEKPSFRVVGPDKMRAVPGDRVVVHGARQR